MTDNEIIKALECCSIKEDCKGCYFDTHEAGDICAREVVKNAFYLIKHQRAEIERLQKYNTEIAYKHYNDGVKEFAERLKEKLQWDVEYDNKLESDIDNLVKEMAGDAK